MITHVEKKVTRWQGMASSERVDCIAEEVPVAFEYNGIAHTVMLATPADLADFALGFSLSEGIVAHRNEVFDIEAAESAGGVTLQLEVASKAFLRLKERRRSLAGRTGCGLCGVETIHEAMRVPERVAQKLAVSRDALFLASHELGERQTINNETSTVHAAAWANASGEIQLVREDIGRHNALDKVLGALARSAAPTRDGFIVVTSRASYEMVQKAAAFGVELVAAVSRPTGLAVRFAELTGITLVGLLRGRTANVYSNSQRIT